MRSTCRPLFKLSTAAIILIDVKLPANHLLVMFSMRHKLVCKDPSSAKSIEWILFSGRERKIYDILSPHIILEHTILFSLGLCRSNTFFYSIFFMTALPLKSLMNGTHSNERMTMVLISPIHKYIY